MENVFEPKTVLEDMSKEREKLEKCVINKKLHQAGQVEKPSG